MSVSSISSAANSMIYCIWCDCVVQLELVNLTDFLCRLFFFILVLSFSIISCTSTFQLHMNSRNKCLFDQIWFIVYFCQCFSLSLRVFIFFLFLFCFFILYKSSEQLFVSKLLWWPCLRLASKLTHRGKIFNNIFIIFQNSSSLLAV